MGKGVYIQASAQELSDPDEIVFGLSTLFERAGEHPPSIRAASGNAPLRVEIQERDLSF
jgi:hypothetical protein